MSRGIVGDKCIGALIFTGVYRKNVRRNVQIPMQDYTSPRAAVMICVTLVNTQIHTDSF